MDPHICKQTHLVLASTHLSTVGNPGIGTPAGTAQIDPPGAAQEYIITASDETLAWDIMGVGDK